MDPYTATVNLMGASINLMDKVFTAMPPQQQAQIAGDVATALHNLSSAVNTAVANLEKALGIHLAALPTAK